jgi:hypothetical protein
MNISYERITTSNRPRLAGETSTQPVLPCDLPDTSRDLEIPSLLFPHSEAAQTAFDVFAVLFWSFYSLAVGLAFFFAFFFLFRG